MAGTTRCWFAATIASLMLVANTGCSAPPSYDGTVVIGSNYVQALVTAPGDAACPPRVQRSGVCVRTLAAGPACTKARPCVSALRVTNSQGVLASADSGFARVTKPEQSAAAIATGAIKIEIDGCGGKLRHEAPAGPEATAFSTATAALSEQSILLQWDPGGVGDLVCALWTGAGIKEVCCGPDDGALEMKLQEGDQVERVYLSRGRLVGRKQTSGGTVEFFRTAETRSLTPE